MGWFSSACSFVSDVASSAVSAISSALGSISGSIGGVAESLLKVAAPYLGPISQIVSLVAQFIGVLKADDNIDELGTKAMEADKKPEDFASNAEYIDYLRNEVELDKEKFDKASDVKKMERKEVGVYVVSKGIEEKKGFDMGKKERVGMEKME